MKQSQLRVAISVMVLIAIGLAIFVIGNAFSENHANKITLDTMTEVGFDESRKMMLESLAKRPAKQKRLEKALTMMVMMTVGSGGGGGDARIQKYYGRYHGMSVDEVIDVVDQILKDVAEESANLKTQMEKSQAVKDEALKKFEQRKSVILSKLNDLIAKNESDAELSTFLNSMQRSIQKNEMKLAIRRTQVTQIPEEIGMLIHLQGLDVSNNKLTSLPETIRQLSELKSLRVNDNAITKLPPEISQLKNLIWLYIDGNPISDDSLNLLKKLQQLRLLNVKGTDLSPEAIQELKSALPISCNVIHDTAIEGRLLLGGENDSETLIALADLSKHEGQIATFKMLVKSTNGMYLFSSENSKDEDNVYVLIEEDANRLFKKSGIDPSTDFMNKSLLIRGRIGRLWSKPMIHIKHSGQIKVVEDD